MRRPIGIAIVIALLAAVGGFVAWFFGRDAGPQELELYGNVDLRQVALAFDDSGRVASVSVQEGDVVKKGQVVATLDTSRLAPLVEQAQAQVAAQHAVVERLHHGSRPEEIAQARANLAAATADAVNARRQYERNKSLESRALASIQDVDAARAAMDVANANVEVARKTLDLAVAGPRTEDIAQAEAQLHADEASLALLNRRLADAQLTAPVDSVVLSRLMEPAEIASPQRPVISLAVTDPKWVRAYVAEPDLGRIRPGMKAQVEVDSFPGRRFDGWIGFISPIAEFTPRTIETQELRTSLVYEVRVFVNDPTGTLRLGMPATVKVPGAEARNPGAQ